MWYAGNVNAANLNRVAPLPEVSSLYFERMASSIGDKRRIIDHLPPVSEFNDEPIRVMDVGAGGGEFSALLAELGYTVTALDASDGAVKKIRRDFPQVSTYPGLANWADRNGPLFDVVIASSVLHEVFSYGDDITGVGAGLPAIQRAFNAFRGALKPGGLLIIRDGVLPANHDQPATLIPTPEYRDQVGDFAERYLRHCPFSNGKALKGNGHLLHLHPAGAGRWAGDLRSAMEFAYTYTWGESSFHREVQELYGVATLNEYASMLERSGFSILDKYSYLQPGYPLHLNPHMQLFVNKAPAEWPDSNAIWVARKK